MVVENVLKELEIPYSNITLGVAMLEKEISETDKTKLADKLESLGFELLQSRKNILAEKIKNLIIQHVQYASNPIPVNISTYLVENMHMDYSQLSNTFSETENMTIEQYTLLQKTEKVKELLSYGEMTLTQIADKMGYTSVAYLSAQFKKQTGISPTQYKNSKTLSRKALDKIKTH